MKAFLLSHYAGISGSWISLASGILLSAGVNILTTVMMTETEICQGWVFISTGVLLLAGAISLYILSTTLDQAKRLWATAQFEEAAWPSIADPYLWKLNWASSIGGVCTLAAVVFVTITIALR